MRVTADLRLKQSLALTTDMRMAISTLSMSGEEISELIQQEMAKNPSLQEFSEPSSFVSHESAFEIALKTTTEVKDFRELLWQEAQLLRLNVFELKIAYALIFSLDDRGLLPDKDEIYQIIIDDLGVFSEWIESVRTRLMALEPVGCCAKDVEEFLLFQLSHRCQYPHDEFESFLKNKKTLTRADIQKLKSDPKLYELKNLLRSPISFAALPLAIEILVENISGKLKVCLLKRASHGLRVVSCGLKDHEKQAHFLIKALRFRENNLLKVAEAIIFYQEAWFLGLGEIRPLSLHDVASISGLHESSISRLTRGKYLSCTKGSFELKYFFSQNALSIDGECSSKAIKEKIRKIIEQENRQKPLSDEQIAKSLKLARMPIARRTVTKYRESLKLPRAKDRFIPDQRSW